MPKSNKLNVRNDSNILYDVCILGAGEAGMNAAKTLLALSNYQVLMLDKNVTSAYERYVTNSVNTLERELFEQPTTKFKIAFEEVKLIKYLHGLFKLFTDSAEYTCRYLIYSAGYTIQNDWVKCLETGENNRINPKINEFSDIDFHTTSLLINATKAEPIKTMDLIIESLTKFEHVGIMIDNLENSFLKYFLQLPNISGYIHSNKLEILQNYKISKAAITKNTVSIRFTNGKSRHFDYVYDYTNCAPNIKLLEQMYAGTKLDITNSATYLPGLNFAGYLEPFTNRVDSSLISLQKTGSFAAVKAIKYLDAIQAKG